MKSTGKRFEENWKKSIPNIQFIHQKNVEQNAFLKIKRIYHYEKTKPSGSKTVKVTSWSIKIK